VPVLPTPVPVITPQGNTALVSSPGLAYQWYVNGEAIPSALGGNQQIIQPTVTGTYYVEVQYNTGCSNLSEGYYFSLSTDVDEVDISQEVMAFPNPTNGQLTVRMDNELRGKFMLRLTNTLGQEIMRTEVSKQENTLDTPLQLESLPSGWYLVEVRGDRYFAVKKVMKQ
jgi:hypothetical protein